MALLHLQSDHASISMQLGRAHRDRDAARRETAEVRAELRVDGRVRREVQAVVLAPHERRRVDAQVERRVVAVGEAQRCVASEACARAARGEPRGWRATGLGLG